MMKMVFSTALKLTINEVGGMYYFASGPFHNTNVSTASLESC